MLDSDESVTIGLVGDTMIGRLINEHLRTVSPEYIWGDMLDELKNLDVFLLNLESALTTSDKEVEKVFNFKSDPKNVHTLKKTDVDVVNLANNHVLDYSIEGLIETLDTLNGANIQYVGAGKNLNEARKPAILNVKGISIGVLGITDNEPEWEAGQKRPGTRYVSVGDIKKIEEDILSLKERVDILILSMHWGPNMRQRPPSHFIEFAHNIADLGVDVIHGHSAHIFQGVERIDKSLILYDTGDFVDDYYVDPKLRNDRSFLFKVTVKKEGIVQLEMIPTIISQFQVKRAKGVDREETLKRMELLSRERGTFLDRKDDCLVLRISH